MFFREESKLSLTAVLILEEQMVDSLQPLVIYLFIKTETTLTAL